MLRTCKDCISLLDLLHLKSEQKNLCEAISQARPLGISEDVVERQLLPTSAMNLLKELLLASLLLEEAPSPPPASAAILRFQFSKLQDLIKEKILSILHIVHAICCMDMHGFALLSY